MPRQGRSFAALAVAASVLLAGCVGSEEPVETTTTTNESDAPALNTTLPDGREFAAVKETNKTEEGLGGMAHTHDYWHGQTQVTLFDRKEYPSGSPFPGRDDVTHLGVVWIVLDHVPGEPDRPALVYEGTGLVEFTITETPAWADTFDLSFRTAATDWSEPVPLKAGETFQYEPTVRETDMPHSSRSLWNWRLVAQGPAPVTGEPIFEFTNATGSQDGAVGVKIVVHKTRDVEDWPGHPDFYDGHEPRVVVDGVAARTSVQHAADVVLFGVEPDQVVPDKLVSMGTRHLDVWVNVTRLDAPVPADGFTLFWRSADVPPNQLGFNPGNNETDGKTWAYWRLTLDDDQLDAPYQPSSRFSFKVLMNAANSEFARCYRCTPYTIEYTMTVIAWPDPAHEAATTGDM